MKSVRVKVKIKKDSKIKKIAAPPPSIFTEAFSSFLLEEGGSDKVGQ